MISNGFDETLVMNAALNRIGFRDGHGSYAIVGSDNQIAKSGRYFQDFHAAVTVQNLKQTQEYPEISNLDFNSYLVSLKKASINEALMSVFNKPQEVDPPKMFFDRLPNTNYRQITNERKFVGWHLNIAKGFNAAVINSVALMFDKDATFNLYLFKDGKIDPVKTLSISVVANDLTIISLEEWVIRSTNGSHFYIGYFQGDTGDAVALDVGLIDLQRYKLIGYIGMEAATEGPINFDRINTAPNWKTYGLNLEVSTYKDFTNEIVKNIHLFDNLIGLQVAMKTVEQLQYNNRSNADQRNASEQMTMRMDRDLNQAIPAEGMPFVPGLKARYNKEVARVLKTFFPRPAVVTSNPGRTCDDNRQVDKYPSYPYQQRDDIY